MGQEKIDLINEISRVQREIFHASWPRRSGEWMELDLTVGQLKVLFYLWGQPPTRMSDLATRLGIALPSCTTMVDRLVKMGMVERREAPLDRRLVLCVLSDAGRNQIDRLWESGQLQTTSILERLTLHELRTVAEAMGILRRALAGCEPDAAPTGSAQGTEPGSTTSHI